VPSPVDDRHPQEQGLKQPKGRKSRGHTLVDDRHPQEQGLKPKGVDPKTARSTTSTTVIHKNKD